ncbi:MAG: hypothetical protein ACYC6Y_08670 [Thermoguttaceae bacterium]
MKIRAECVPGRPGCVLRHNSVFAVPWELRLAEKRGESKRPDVDA